MTLVVRQLGVQGITLGLHVWCILCSEAQRFVSGAATQGSSGTSSRAGSQLLCSVYVQLIVLMFGIILVFLLVFVLCNRT
jgi:hypothetical protein